MAVHRGLRPGGAVTTLAALAQRLGRKLTGERTERRMSLLAHGIGDYFAKNPTTGLVSLVAALDQARRKAEKTDATVAPPCASPRNGSAATAPGQHPLLPPSRHREHTRQAVVA